MMPRVLSCFPDAAGEPFQPSNGTEGMIWMDAFCERCIHERWMHFPDEDREEDKCDLMTRSMLHEPGDKEYPKEWVYDNEGWPVCTAWKKWDWGNDDDGWNEPIEPIPDDPNQLLMPFDIVDLFGRFMPDVVVMKDVITDVGVLKELEHDHK